MFKTAPEGHVYNDDRKNSGSHHGSVKPKTGIKSKTIINSDKFDTKELKQFVDDLHLKNYDYTVLVRKNWAAYIMFSNKNGSAVPAIPSHIVDKIAYKLKTKGFEWNGSSIFKDPYKPKVELEFIKVR